MGKMIGGIVLIVAALGLFAVAYTNWKDYSYDKDTYIPEERAKLKEAKAKVAKLLAEKRGGWELKSQLRKMNDAKKSLQHLEEEEVPELRMYLIASGSGGLLLLLAGIFLVMKSRKPAGAAT